METNALHNRGGRPDTRFVLDELHGIDISTWDEVSMAFYIGESCPWYPTGTSSLWRVEGLSPSTIHRFTVLYLGTPEAVPALQVFSHGNPSGCRYIMGCDPYEK